MRSDFPRSGRRELATAADTQEFGWRLGKSLEAGDLVILDGPLGAGKTTFTQGIARGMQVKGRVTSPTFVIAREHHSQVGGPALIHVDAYRLVDDFGAGSGDPLGDLDALDLDTALEDAVVVAEWGGGLVEQISESYLFINIDREAIAQDSGTDTRVFTWSWENGGE
ncbi:MAG: tRNA (adenosine(37)-N6)-threonylcarbamoyltransferase complex ATPase subunit type 1 TsaE [Corynebacterium flavescens]|uniref:tRNA (adenosine(37)-N6)-threonylcarbamoyltransferase complex ATPase subunit type 1 TsaE n=1 Tax=Corynebacterium flavescens TaxID=28028 RepID=UPI0026488F00|nr:tRNA (adenosine(37)-N6)-threonylcarbamoyltransferase complex ATPase subunit type 1 TsaE [Corynebacterium flavescens]MDN6099576.1 tRNA (adenosine(37)-N6)-threonylcarbamoyltransferase complex ATPase subunit type 1 TsaE [Corynebacterium flavescens]MDN6198716.1 tRNA (adenosine(37)-N6)-threonylcarbamoyltransferase complex ATPase subunit type 1 TsaE [Corynebacterium flavescens]MDN6226420.1 tRNA (adenosine(37)-N6)-threonylcarbamoyltransferase complex ATPase subunit type 1 TsaE [Corynebacterium flave